MVSLHYGGVCFLGEENRKGRGFLGFLVIRNKIPLPLLNVRYKTEGPAC
jgi:hypothetical protein